MFKCLNSKKVLIQKSGNAANVQDKGAIVNPVLKSGPGGKYFMPRVQIEQNRKSKWKGKALRWT